MPHRPSRRPAPRGRARRSAPLAALAAAGLALACGGGGDAPVTPPPPPPPGGGPAPTLRISPASDSLTAIHATTRLAATRTDGAAAEVYWSSGDTTVVVVSQAGTVVARGPGTTTATARASDGATATARIVVRQDVATVAIAPAAAARPVGRVQRFVAVALDAGGTPVPGHAAVWTAPDADRVTVDAAGVATARAPGIDTVRATIAGVTGVATLRVVDAPTPQFPADTIVVGVGQTVYRGDGALPRLVVDSIAEGETSDLVVSTSDPAVVSVDADAGTVESWEQGEDQRVHRLTITGRRAGTARLSTRLTGYLPTEAVVVVTTPRLVSDAGPDGVARFGVRPVYGQGDPAIAVGVADSTGRVHRAAAPVTVTARSTNEAVIRPLAATAGIEPGEPGVVVPLETGVPGRARLVLTAPGHAPDTLVVEVTADGPRFQHLVGAHDRPATIGVGLKDEIGTVYVRPPAADPEVAITLTQRRPDLLRIPARVSRASSIWHEAFVALEGLAPGTDTIVATIPGYPPDSLVVHVTTPRLVTATDPWDPAPVGTRRVHINERAGYRLVAADSTGRSALLAGPAVRLRVTSTDPAVLRPTAPSATFASSGTNVDEVLVGAAPVGLGTAALRVEAEDGRFPPFTTPPVTVVPSRLEIGVLDEPDDGAVTLGMGQSFGWARIWARIDYPGDAPATVHLRSTDPRIVRPVVDSAIQEGFDGGAAHFDVVAGDVVGSAWIVASGVGLVPDSVRVDVGRPRFAFVRESGDEGAMGGFKVRLLDQTGTPRSVAAPFEIALGTSNAAVLGFSRPTVTFHPNGRESDFVPWVSLKAGGATLVVRDPAGTSRYDPQSTPPLAVPAPR